MIALIIAPHAGADNQCGLFRPRTRDLRFDLAPPDGFVEICSKNAILCRTLTVDYPPSAETLGYFVTHEEWNKYNKYGDVGFTRYLIAQLAKNIPSDEFLELRNHIRSQHGHIPDNTQPPELLERRDVINLGVFEDTDDWISFATVLRLKSRLPGPSSDLNLVATNSAIVLKRWVLSLYVFVKYSSRADIEDAKRLTRNWVGCLRKENRD